jgi:hypothetical protein
MRTERQTAMTNLTVAFRNFANTYKNGEDVKHTSMLQTANFSHTSKCKGHALEQ